MTCLADLLPADIHKRSQMGQRKGLSAVLVAGHLRNDLRGDVAGSEKAVRLLDHGLADDGAVLQHILQVDQVTVVLLLCEIVRIMEMDDSGLMCLTQYPPAAALAWSDPWLTSPAM